MKGVFYGSIPSVVLHISGTGHNRFIHPSVPSPFAMTKVIRSMENLIPSILYEILYYGNN